MKTTNSENNSTLGFYCENFFSPRGRWACRMRAKGHDYSDQYFSIHRGHLENYIIPAFGGQKPDSIKRRDIDNWLLELERPNGGKLAGATKNKIMYTLSMIFEELVDLEVAEKNPTSGIVPFKKKLTRPREAIDRFSLLQLFPRSHKALLRVWGSQLWLSMMMLLYDTGSRPGEARALTWEDIDFTRRFIPIRKGIQSGTSNAIKGTKNGVVRIGFPTFQTVQELQNWRRLSRYNNDADFVFTHNGKKPVSAVAVIRAFKRGLDRAGIQKPYTPYWLRHSFGTYQMEHLSQSELMKLMGHHASAVTRIYQHPDNETLYQSAETIKKKLDLARETPSVFLR